MKDFNSALFKFDFFINTVFYLKNTNKDERQAKIFE